MKRTISLLLFGSTALVGAMSAVALHAWHGYTKIYRPAEVDIADSYFLAQQLPPRSEPTSPLSLERANLLQESVPADIDRAVFVRTSVSVLGSDNARRREALFVSDNFVEFAGLRLLAGRGDFELGDRHGGSPCLVSARFARELNGTAASAIGTAVTTTRNTTCVVVGVVADRSVEYWMADASIVAPLARQREFPGFAVPENSKNLAVHFIVRLRDLRRRAEVMVAADRAVTATDDRALQLVRAPDYLFAAPIRRSARLAYVTAGVAAFLSLLLIVVWLAFTRELDSRNVRTHAVLGASAGRYFAHVLRRSFVACGAGALAVLPADALLVAQGFCNETLHSPLVSFTPTLTAYLSTHLAFGAVSALHLRRISGRILGVAPVHSALEGVPISILHCAAPGLILVAIAYQAAYHSMTRANLGIQPDNIAAFELNVRPGTPGQVLLDDLKSTQRDVSLLPGVSNVGLSSINPLLDTGFTWSVTIENVGRFLNGEASHVTPGRHVISPGFAKAVGAHIVAGRDLEWNDVDRLRPVLVNEAAVRQFWNGEPPIGRRLKFGRPREPEPWATVVGVISDIRHEGYRGAIKPEIYLSYVSDGHFTSSLHLLVRWAQHMEPSAVERVIGRQGRTFEVARVMPLAEAADLPIRSLRLSRTLMLGITWVAVGGYGIGLLLFLLTDISRRKREIAIHLALGASARNLLMIQLGRRVGRALALGGVGIGVSILLVTLISRIDYDIQRVGFVTAILVGVVPPALTILTALTSMAAYQKVEPASLLRSQ